VKRADEILAKVEQGQTWTQVLSVIKGIGPWTIAVFRIMVIRDPNVLPEGDVGLERAIQSIYGAPQDAKELRARWHPFCSVACWYLWRTLGNEQLG
jgi:DNA-3-methyladenine glycosylase II